MVESRRKEGFFLREICYFIYRRGVKKLGRRNKNRISLSEEQRLKLRGIVTNGKHPAKKVMRARILLLLDENCPSVKKQKEIADICYTSETTVRTVAMQFNKYGFESLDRKKRVEPPVKPIVTEEVGEQILAIYRSEPPKGCRRWTLNLVATRLMELGIVPTISRDTVSRFLRKNQTERKGDVTNGRQ